MEFFHAGLYITAHLVSSSRGRQRNSTGCSMQDISHTELHRVSKKCPTFGLV